MTLLFMDGMDRYGLTSELSRNYEAVSSSGITLLTGGGAFGGGAIRVDDDDKYFDKTIPGNPQTCVISFRIFRVPDNPTAPDFVMFIDNNTGGGLIKFLSTVGSLALSIRRGSTTLGSFDLPLGSWQWVSIKIKASNTVGTIDIEVAGSNVFSFSGDTVNTGSETCNNVRFGAVQGQDSTYDDLFITDIAGGAPFNDLLGDMRIETLLPDAIGDNADFAATPAVDNYLNVDDVAPDDDTTYVESSTLADKDLHNFGALTVIPGDIEVVNVFALAKNPLGGGANLKLLVFEGITEGAGAAQALGSDYGYINELFLVNPDTSAKWTETEVNAMQAGYENA